MLIKTGLKKQNTNMHHKEQGDRCESNSKSFPESSTQTGRANRLHMPTNVSLRLQLGGCCAPRLRNTCIRHGLSLVFAAPGYSWILSCFSAGTGTAKARKQHSTSYKACDSSFQIEILLMGSGWAFVLQH